MGDLHPDRFGSPIPNTTTTTGRNRNDGAYPESSYLKCKKCGFVMNSVRHPKGRGEGNSQPYTQLNGALTAGDTTINVDSTTGFPSSGYIYIYDTGLPCSASGHRMNKVAYTGTTSTSFTGCSDVSAHADDMTVRGEVTSSGCPCCGTYNYN